MSVVWNQRECEELIEVVKASKTKTEGFRIFAQKHGMTFDVVKKKFYSIFNSKPSEPSKELPNGQQRPSEILRDNNKIQELLGCIKECGSRDKGVKLFAQRNNLTHSGVRNYFYKHILTPELDKQLPCKEVPQFKKQNRQQESSASTTVTVEQAVLDAIRRKGDLPLEKEDIQAAADRAGVHYHTALSTWGNMVANAKAFITTEPCGDRNCPWFKGDIFLAMTKNGMTYNEIAKIANIDVLEVKKLIDICFRFPKEKRSYPLPIDYYDLVLGKDNPDEWLQKAVNFGWSLEDLRAALRGETTDAEMADGLKNENKAMKEENELLKKELEEISKALAEAEEKRSKAEREVKEIREKWSSALKIFGKNTDRLVEKAKRLEEENAELKAKFSEKVEADKKILEKKIEESVNIVSLEHIVGLYETIARLESQVDIARRVNSFILEALVKKNAELLKVKCPTVAHQEKQEQQGQQTQLHIN